MSLLLLLRGEGDYNPPVSGVGFTQPKDVIVRVQALDGTWETCGADRARGIVPENVQLVSDQWGSKTASFDLRRDPKAIWPDIGAFAPVEVEVGGRLVWSGRVAETPVRDSVDSVISVQCEGWQAHLDDDLYERVYVHTDLSEWRDMRSYSGATLGTAANLKAAGQVAQDNVLSVMFPSGTVMAQFDKVGVQLDLGESSTAKRVVVSYTTSNNDANAYFAIFGSDGDYLNNFESSTTQALSVASGTLSVTFTTARRYVALVLQASTAHTAAADLWVKATSIQVFADTAYESSNASVLKADQVVKDALSRATLLLSSDQSAVEAGTFSIPELAPSEPRTPREMWNAVDAFEDRYKKIDVLRQPIYKAKPSTPEVEVGAWSGMEFEDSSANSGDEVYSGVVVTGTQADGTSLRTTRTQAQQSGVLSTALTSPAVTNPSFATNTSGWTPTVSSGSITATRDTVTFDSTPASLRLDRTGASDDLPATVAWFLEGTTTGTFVKGVTYSLTFRFKPSTGSFTQQFNTWFGNRSTGDYKAATYSWTTTAWQTVTVSWTPASTQTSGVTVYIWQRALVNSANVFWFDSFSIAAAQPTVVERRGFARTKQLATSFTLTTTAAQQIADKWLLAHKTSPFKGRAKLTGNQAVRDLKTGRNIPAEELLLRTGELIRFSDRIDPDTGATGRDGRLVEAQYNAEEDSTSITIDSSRAGFEALLERLGVVLGQNRFS